MYKSIHEKLLTLADDTEIFPAHGAGSRRPPNEFGSSTIGKQRKSTRPVCPARRIVHPLTDTFRPGPRQAAQTRIQPTRAALIGTAAADPVECRKYCDCKRKVIAVDTRPVMQFAVAHVPGRFISRSQGNIVGRADLD
jgi:hypothetical protein